MIQHTLTCSTLYHRISKLETSRGIERHRQLSVIGENVSIASSLHSRYAMIDTPNSIGCWWLLLSLSLWSLTLSSTSSRSLSLPQLRFGVWCCLSYSGISLHPVLLVLSSILDVSSTIEDNAPMIRNVPTARCYLLLVSISYYLVYLTVWCYPSPTPDIETSHR